MYFNIFCISSVLWKVKYELHCSEASASSQISRRGDSRKEARVRETS